jgi:hypothetical protein
MKTKMITLVLVLGSWGAFAQHDHAKMSEAKPGKNIAMFKDAILGDAYKQYIYVKDALVASKSDEAKKGANELLKSLKDVNGAAAAMEVTSKLAIASDLAEQRKVFSTLSNEMATLVKGDKLSTGMLYLEYCPMANSNAGGYWLSNEKEIKNPYFGDMMLKCGSVKETIQ